MKILIYVEHTIVCNIAKFLPLLQKQTCNRRRSTNDVLPVLEQYKN